MKRWADEVMTSVLSYYRAYVLAITVTVISSIFAQSTIGESGTYAHQEPAQTDNVDLPKWKPGYLDIHHISTGRGNAAFFQFPDGTTMLFDAGDLNPEGSITKHAPLKVASLRPDDSMRAGQWIARYISQVSPEGDATVIDYAVISHFHADHYGDLTGGKPLSKTGAYRLTGITDVGELIPIRRMIDRGYPTYDVPVDLREHYAGDDSTFFNYLAFIDYHVETQGMKVAPLQVGSNSQITLLRDKGSYPGFSVRNLSSNGSIWAGSDSESATVLEPEKMIDHKGRFNENPLSVSLKVSYGDFDYFTGGDLTGQDKPPWRFDVETPLAKVVGPVDVITLNHHGNRDATNASFLKAMAPRVFVSQSWCSDHPGEGVLNRLLSKELYGGPRDGFATHTHPETYVTYGPALAKAYKSMNGHVVIRVVPGGQEYFVFVLDDMSKEVTVRQRYGPYQSR